jgi:hypothetical protein
LALLHRNGSPIHGEAFLLDERLYRLFALVVRGNARNRESLFAEFLLRVNEARNLLHATRAPCGPEDDKHNLAFVVRQIDPFAVGKTARAIGRSMSAITRLSLPDASVVQEKSAP